MIGGGHRRLAAGFSATASWTGVMAANAAATALCLGLYLAGIAAILIWGADIVRRALRLVIGANHPTRPVAYGPEP